MKLKLTVEYFGGVFHGWQEQPGLVTVQGSLKTALQTLCSSLSRRRGIPWEGEVKVSGSGRTDSGVHARGQVASFFWPEQLPYEEKKVFLSLNALTPPQLAIKRIEIVDDSFDARFTAKRKCYSYRILLRSAAPGLAEERAWCVPQKLDISAMVRAARLFVGVHDFQSFRARDCSALTTERTIYLSEIARTGEEELLFIVHGSGFMKQMIRIMVGTLVEIGKGKYPPEYITQLIDLRDRTKAGVTAPPDGLTLEWVDYGSAGPVLADAQDIEQEYGE